MNIKKYRLIIFTVAVILLQQALTVPYARAEKIVLVATKTGSYYVRYCKLAYTEAFKRLGYTFDIMECPSKRCGIMANTGQVDGIMTRVFDYNKDYPNIVRVNYIMFQHRFLAFALDPSIKLEGWNSLADTKFQVLYLHGSARPANKLTRLVNSDNLQTVASSRQGLFMLVHGRTDIYVDLEALVMPVLEQSENGDFFLLPVKSNEPDNNASEVYSSPIYMAGVLETVNAYPFLHKKHQKLAPKLAAVLHNMEQEGLFEKFKTAVNLQSIEKNE